MAVGSLAAHIQAQHGGEAQSIRQRDEPPLDRDPQTYRKAFPTSGGAQEFPVKGCKGCVATRMTMGVPFLNRYLQDTVIILEEVNPPHPRCPPV